MKRKNKWVTNWEKKDCEKKTIVLYGIILYNEIREWQNIKKNEICYYNRMKRDWNVIIIE